MGEAPRDAGALARTEWDAIVVGTGIGGATIGHALARAGWRVLFCERGRSHLGSREAIVGDYPEQFVDDPLNITDAQLSLGGRQAERILDASGRRARRFRPFVGCGAGGSSALYGMALERLFPSDFAPQANHPEAAGSALEAAWPITYEALAPYYAAAEALYRVRGSADPLRETASDAQQLMPPPDLTPDAAELQRFLVARGLHPYRVPQACEFVQGCASCQGYLCSRRCKNDAASICLEPALRESGAELLDGCEVLHIQADAHRVTRVVCNWRSQAMQLRARFVVLAAGALKTPSLLLRSVGPDWPQGVANRSGLVGRCLMRHCIDLYLVQPSQPGSAPDNRFKELAFSDFYQASGCKLGSVQSFGRLPPGRMLFASLQEELRGSRAGWLAPALPLARRFMQPLLDRMATDSLVLASIMEDLPYASNRVSPAPDGSSASVQIEYCVSPYDRWRIRRFRTLMADALRGRRWRRLAQAENNERIAHACGTCRFGSDPRTSVLDAHNRAHDLDNLYVVDSSFFPSSGGTNPALTIAANALRVAAHLAARRP